MGNQLQISNYEYVVSASMDKTKSIFIMRVRKRSETGKVDQLAYLKQYRYFDLPEQIKERFKSVQLFYKFLKSNQGLLQIWDKRVRIIFDDKVVDISFENFNRQSIKMTEYQRQQLTGQNKEKQGYKNVSLIGINLTMGSSNNNEDKKKNSHSIDNQCYKKMSDLYRKLMRLNQRQYLFPTHELRFQMLVQSIEIEYQLFQTRRNTISGKDLQINLLGKVTQLQEENKKLTDQIKAQNAKIQVLMELANPQKNQKIRRQVQQLAQKKTQQNFIRDIWFHLSGKRIQQKVQIRIKDKQTILAYLDNLIKQFEQMKDQRKLYLKRQEDKNRFNRSNSLKKESTKHRSEVIGFGIFQDQMFEDMDEETMFEIKQSTIKMVDEFQSSINSNISTNMNIQTL